MTLLKIQRLHDFHDCETCGCSDADGARVYLDYKLILELTPVAHCYDPIHYDDNVLFAKILDCLGLTCTDLSDDPQKFVDWMAQQSIEVEFL